MTIAAGVLYDGGILLAADSMVASYTFRDYQAKIRDCKFDDGVMAAALAGVVPFAESTIQQCENRLKRTPKEPRTHERMIDSLRSLWAHEYRTHVQNQFEEDFSAIIGVWSQVNGLGLYATSRTSIRCIESAYECIGVGIDLAKYLLGRDYPGRELELENLIVSAFGRVKQTVPGCGGDTMLVKLRPNGLCERGWALDAGKRVFVNDWY